MPTTLTESDVFTATVPVPIDTEAATSASLIQFAQPLANRTLYLKNLLQVTGAPRIRQGSGGAMVGLTSAQASEGDVFLFRDSSEVRGLFVLFTSGGLLSVPADGEFIIGAHASHPAGSKWFHIEWNKLNLSNGFPRLTGGKIVASQVPYGHYVTNLIAPSTVADTTLDTTPITATAGDIIEVVGGGGTVTIGALAIGDIVDCRLPMIGFNSGGHFSVGAYISFDDGATWEPVSPSFGGSPITYAQTVSGTGVPVSVDFVKAVTVAGICKVRFKFNRVSAGTTNVWWGAGRIRTERP